MATPYDVVRYPGHAFPQTHPDRVAALAVLFGLDAPPPAGCRLLEIGCGDGGNLLPMAVALPGASFVGFDTSAGAIARARELAGALGLANVRFEKLGVESFDAPAGSFDYAIAHGIFSWVPAPARERLLALCGHVLSERGIAYVSYNALPGAHLRQPLRELLALEPVVGRSLGPAELDACFDDGRHLGHVPEVIARLDTLLPGAGPIAAKVTADAHG
jgi:SAM-dependent methyltransferase